MGGCRRCMRLPTGGAAHLAMPRSSVCAGPLASAAWNKQAVPEKRQLRLQEDSRSSGALAAVRRQPAQAQHLP